MYRVCLFAAVTLLAGCVSPQARQAAEAETLFKDILARPLVSDSVMREGDILTFQISQSGNAQAAAGVVFQMEASCAADRANLLYLGGGGRMYPGLNGHQYSIGRAMPANVLGMLKNNPDFIKACASTPASDWRVVKGSGEEQWVLFDRNSLKKDGSELRFWAAYDNPLIGFDAPYDAPYAQKRERYAVDCGKQTYRVVAGYDLDADNTVTDGQDAIALTSNAISGSNDDYELLFKLVCEKPESAAQLPRFVARAKKSAPVTLPTLTPAVTSAIKQLNMPDAVKPLNYVEITGQSNYQGKTIEMREVRRFEIDSASQQLSLHLSGANYESDAVTFRGLLDLAKLSRFSVSKGPSMKDTSSVINLGFSGDWQHMPVNGHLAYKATFSSTNSLLGKVDERQENTNCTVVRELSASQLNSTLSGLAKELRCSKEGDEYNRVNTYYYLSDYAYFFFARTDKNRFFYSDLVLKTLR
ncbi:hypothetical protein C1893_07215 [Pseudomonas sp. MPR-ANC1]|uniref:hypothetical protein n=1 Tax=Pseudomonas sp. MPR-ANC1 TaxID=2075548 RepID=UPI000CD220A4|nr:hypothetical protein [Pseudomonas sp. MPR-ANC1]POA49403.1 hypothetical protein C1893_07215 [Pseudomonas sp. MPR-ANC1]